MAGNGATGIIRSGGRLLLVLVPIAAALLALQISFLGLPPGRSLPAREDLARAFRLVGAGDYAAALGESSRIVAAHPDSAEGLAALGLVFVRTGDYELAAKTLGRAAEMDPACGAAWLGLGEMAVGRNRADEARDLLRKAARDERVARSAWAELARLSLHVGDARAALAAAERAAASPAAGDVTGEESIGATVAYLRMLGPEPLLGMRPGFDGTIVRFLEREGWRDRGAREVPVEINGAGSWPVDIDSAYRGNLILSERLASDLGIRRAGEFGAAGVGATAPVLEGSLLDEIRIGSLVLRRVPVMVMDSPSFRGEAKGLLGTGLLKRFDCVLDERAGTFEIRPPGRPDDAGGRIAARAPLFVEGGPIVNAGLAGGPRRPFLLDTAASVTLLDRGYYERHVKPALPAGAAREAVVAGAGGRETAILIPDLQAVIGNSGIGRLRVVVLDMSRINRAGGRLASGIVGGELLRRYRVHLRFSVPEILLEEYREEPGV